MAKTYLKTYKKEAAARKLRAQGFSISAIKLLRDANGFGLKEAKDIVESWPNPNLINRKPLDVSDAAIRGFGSLVKGLAKSRQESAVNRRALCARALGIADKTPTWPVVLRLIPLPLLKIECDAEGYFWLRVSPPNGPFSSINLGNSHPPTSLRVRSLLAALNVT